MSEVGYLALIEERRGVGQIADALRQIPDLVVSTSGDAADVATTRCPDVSIVLAPGRRCVWLSLTPLSDLAVARCGGYGRLVTFLDEISSVANVHLGRTHSASGVSLLEEREYDQPEFVDWYQYFDATLTSRWGAAAVTAGPFETVSIHAGGGCSVLLGPTPDTLRSRRTAAHYLGITLRPALTRNSRGEAVELHLD